MKILWITPVLAGIGFAAAAVAAPQALPLSAILQNVEKQPGRVVEAELDDGLWEIRLCAPAACQKLYVDPASGKEVRRRPTDMEALPPQNAKALSAIVRQVEGEKRGRITEVEFDHGVWEVKLRQGLQSHKLWLDPLSGKQLR